MNEQGESAKRQLARRLIRRRGVMIVWACIVMAATAAIAQPIVGTVTETVTTRRDLNGRDVVSEKVVTQRARTNDEERVVIEIYLPSIEADRLTLSRRISRVTTVTQDGSRTIEETEERNRVSPGEPLRAVQRSVTTLSRSGDTDVSERQIFERDSNGRFVVVRTETEETSR